MLHARAGGLTINSVLPNSAYDPTSAFVSPPYSADIVSATTPSPVAQNQPKDANRHDDKDSGAPSRPYIRSPFEDCREAFAFGTFKSLEFQRPNDGFVNGYVKVRWPDKTGQRQLKTARMAVSMNASTSFSSDTVVIPVNPNVSFSPDVVMWDNPPSSANGAVVSSRADTSPSDTPLQSQTSSRFSFVDGTSFPMSQEWTPAFPSVPPSQAVPGSNSATAMVPAATPRMVPPQFGFQAKMESNTDRKFWDFYIQNWCPGRSILQGTNLWLNDFAKMHEHDGIRCAIQSLAGVYIYDYVPQASVRKRINELFKVAEARMTALLNDPDIMQDDKASELITITIVLTERRRPKPHLPRWLEGFLRCEFALQMTDPGSRFWQPNNVQLTSLRISQSIIVGRAVILAQPMMPLPEPGDFDPRREAKRFGWLLYGTEKEMYEIHGGCGFSKRLLYVLSQVTSCASRLMQESESPIAPVTAEFLLKELDGMRQWSNESQSWEIARASLQTIEWVRSLPAGFIINSSSSMTDVTAEAWRVAAIIYLQCRAMRYDDAGDSTTANPLRWSLKALVLEADRTTTRLPRNHPEVLGNLHDLAQCIRIMPTSGSHFTAQAPLFPVFLLGLLGTDPQHVAVSRNWFEQVVITPVRSSVPPLWSALQRIWEWMPTEIPIDYADLPKAIGKRTPWWEHLVARVHEKEAETLCLT
ncbi:hypothetical protein GMORB2_0882 [Geosmithia morbida]|uniref:Transcription factor domain-containing protein n=1 Tax=Geosmithia morbida TaxID=1094350 RepID=A0A9P4Z1N0_9HYPO|nr:uncharacterized protein GMORB2_0882 [Geosmithia morbida]KAF4125638.1 hypothetical protein GMORB2_0882 [Geosmithia morbida]